MKDRDDHELHAALVALGVSMGVQRYVGQHPTAAAHEFADKAQAVIRIVEESRREPARRAGR